MESPDRRTSSSDSDTEGAPLTSTPIPDVEVVYTTRQSVPKPLVMEETDVKGAEPSPDPEPVIIAPRAYQLELLEASLKENIIVSMDTGSGKTQVAVMRIQHELEHTAPDKRVWFLTPTVALCVQQHRVIQSQMPAVQSRTLTSADDVESWSDIQVWTAALLNIRVVVCTYSILKDALTHAFVSLDSISLLVFDEAHNCTKKNPARLIMTGFYYPRKSAGEYVPSILGLTASPVVRSDVSTMEDLESSLDAMCRGPTFHREELLANVNRPVMITVDYSKNADRATTVATRNMRNLSRAVDQLDITEDPYVRSLIRQGNSRSKRLLEKTLISHDTYTQNQMRALKNRSITLMSDLGAWAVDNYIYEVVQQVTSTAASSLEMVNWTVDEKAYLARVLTTIDAQLPTTACPTPETTSPKLKALLNILIENGDSAVGIIFVKERATASVLSKLLSTIPEITARYTVDCMVGMSQSRSKKANFYDLPQPGDDYSALEKFRAGEVNLLVATSVLEEGIDVPVCNLVTCFDMPANLKSFIQRRGRARMRESKLYLLPDPAPRQSQPELQWRALEEEMKRRYEDDMRTNEHLEHLEAAEEEDEQLSGFAPLRARGTAARLTIDDAKGHLAHFCSVVVTQKYVDSRPEYLINDTGRTVLIAGNRVPLVTATVLLPASLAPGLRQATSEREWASQRNACKDAAFQAYKTLYAAGLVNENLLPIRETDFDRDVEGRLGLMEVEEQWNPWVTVAEEWEMGPLEVHRRRVQLTDHTGFLMAEVDAMLPLPFPPLEHVDLYWTVNSEHPWRVSFDADLTMLEAQDTISAAEALEQTKALLTMAFGYRFPITEQSRALRLVWPNTPLRTEMIGAHPFSWENHAECGSDFLVRYSSTNIPYFYQSRLAEKPPLQLVQHWPQGIKEAPDGVPYLAVRKLPKTFGVLHATHNSSVQTTTGQTQGAKAKPYNSVLPEGECRIDAVPISLVQFGMLVPTITHALEPYLIARELLRSTPLGKLEFRDIGSVVTAITASSAQSGTNYERIEFLGDTILKVFASVTCAANNLNFPEGYLSLFKDRIVSNSRLCRASIKFGLDRFIMTRSHTLKDWRKRMEAKQYTTQKRQMSTKTLADVVEALIGTAYVDGGPSKALGCISILIPNDKPNQKWRSLDEAKQILFDAAPDDTTLPTTLAPLEEMLGYTFRRKSLLVEAVTHASYNVPGEAGQCLERLEFLGDSILDVVVVRRLFAIKDPKPIAHFDMHLLRTALVNADFLGFLAMEWRAPATTTCRVKTEMDGDGVVRALITEVDAPGPSLWEFLRCQASGDLARELRLTAKRHIEMVPDIREALGEGSRYPWDLLARLHTQKLFSDVLEAVIGAVWVDSGSLDACEAVAERAGIMGYLRRAVADGVKMLHPKEELGRLAVSDKVSYEVVEGGEGKRREFTCSVSVGERFIARVEGGVTREEAMTRAAQEAVKLWEDRGGKWDVEVGKWQ